MLAVCLMSFPGMAQKYMTRTGKVSFFSSTPVENIEAINNETGAIFSSEDRSFTFIVPVKSFRFANATMQDHFNDNYMESDKYPRAEFKGNVVKIALSPQDTLAVSGQSIKDILENNGTYPVSVTGRLTIHGVTRDVTIPGTLAVKGKELTAHAKFMVKPDDYKIKIPALTVTKIAKEIEVTVNCILQQL